MWLDRHQLLGHRSLEQAPTLPARDQTEPVTGAESRKPASAGPSVQGDARQPPVEALHASDWRDIFEERAAIREYDGGYARAEAERLAWGELQNRWHMVQGERIPRDLCAGCRRPIGNAEALDLIDSNRVHLADNNECLIAHGAGWRKTATEALVALGLLEAKPAEWWRPSPPPWGSPCGSPDEPALRSSRTAPDETPRLLPAV